MAQIILSPSERFSHKHATESTTTLLAGEVTLLLNSRETMLRKFDKVTIPPDIEHTMINVGSESAVVDCAGCVT